MKKAFLLICVAALLFSCKKSSSGPSTNNNNNSNNNTTIAGNDSLFFVSSVKSYNTGQLVEDSFVYNNVNKVSKFLQYNYDTTSGTPQKDSIITVFTFTGTDTVASSYIQGSQQHLLTYDAQDRVVKDTCIGGSGYVVYFSYNTNNIICTSLLDGTLTNSQIDTLNINSSGNVTSSVLWNSPSDLSSISFAFSSYNNPMYNPGITKTQGPVIFIQALDGVQGIVDNISKKQSSNESIIDEGSFVGSVGFVISLDARKRVAQYTASGTTVIFTYY